MNPKIKEIISINPFIFNDDRIISTPLDFCPDVLFEQSVLVLS